MRVFSQKIGVSFLAVLVLFSTFSFTISSHYCGEHLVDTSFFGEARDCRGMKPSEIAKKQTIITKKSCCKDVKEFIEAPAFEKERLQKISPDKFNFIVAFAYSYIYLFQESSFQPIFNKEFPPPDPEQDYQALLQTYLI